MYLGNEVNMNTKIKFIRFVFALVLALSTLGVSASAVLADKPTKSEFSDTGSGVITDVCDFPVNINSTTSGTETDYFDKSGALTKVRVHITEQDTFTVGENTLVGIPFTFNVSITFDSSGNVTQWTADGIVEKVPLPDGSLFISAGQVDFLTHGFPPPYVISADKGNPGNVAAFCAALAP
jgi:hypothetical protein